MTCYLTGVSNTDTRLAASSYLYGRLGVLLGPATFGGPGAKINYVSHIPDYHAWGLDNGCFTNQGQFDEPAWLARLSWILDSIEGAQESCRFALAPDVFYPDLMRGDMLKTIERSLPVLLKIRQLGVPAGLVFQDGALEMDFDQIPWSEFDVAFLGGGDEFKLGGSTRSGLQYVFDRESRLSRRWAELLYKIHQEGKWLHVGRVSSALRLALAREIWADSADGTYIKYRGNARGLAEIDQWTKPPATAQIQAIVA